LKVFGECKNGNPIEKSIYSFFIAVYILYYVNIHNTVKLLSDNNKFGKTSYVLAAVNIAMQTFIDITSVPKELGRIISMVNTVLIILSVFLSHRTQFLKTTYVTFLYFAVESCSGGTINLLTNLVVPAGYRELSANLVYFIYNLTYCLVFTKFVLPRKDDLKLSLEFINRKIYLFILAYAVFFSKMISFISVASRKRVDMDMVFLYLRIFVIPICILSFFIITMLIMNSMSKFYYKRSAELLDKQLDMQARYY